MNSQGRASRFCIFLDPMRGLIYNGYVSVIWTFDAALRNRGCIMSRFSGWRALLSFILMLVLSGIADPALLYSMEKTFKNSIGMEFVLVPGGSFTMGSPQDELNRDKSEDLHPVTLTKPFYMQATEVTLAQWRSLMGKKLFGRDSGPETKPVTRVSWFDCMEFVEKLNSLKQGVYRLPTEAEWEYACRAGSAGAYHCGKEIDCSKAMFGNSTQRDGSCVSYVKSKSMEVNAPAPVKSYTPNAWGLYDMHGNVWEWCQDWYGEYARTAVTDPVGPEKGTEKVRRGGSWVGERALCRSANRAYAHPGSRFYSTGFRVVREAR